MDDKPSDGGPRDPMEEITARVNDPHWKFYGQHPDGERDVRWLVAEVKRLRAALRGDGPAPEPSGLAIEAACQSFDAFAYDLHSDDSELKQRLMSALRAAYAMDSLRGAPALSGGGPAEPTLLEEMIQNYAAAMHKLGQEEVRQSEYKPRAEELAEEARENLAAVLPPAAAPPVAGTPPWDAIETVIAMAGALQSIYADNADADPENTAAIEEVRRWAALRSVAAPTPASGSVYHWECPGCGNYLDVRVDGAPTPSEER